MSETTNVNTKDSIAYSGTVKVTIVKNNKPIKKTTKKNAGTYALFKTLTLCLLGDDVSTRIPQFIGAWQGVVPTRTRAKIGTKYITDNTESTSGTATSSIKFVANIPYSYLTLDGASNPITALGLYNSLTADDSTSLLAKVDLGQDEQITLDNSGYSALIEWTLTITNQTN